MAKNVARAGQPAMTKIKASVMSLTLNSDWLSSPGLTGRSSNHRNSAGAQLRHHSQPGGYWMPAFAGMTLCECTVTLAVSPGVALRRRIKLGQRNFPRLQAHIGAGFQTRPGATDERYEACSAHYMPRPYGLQRAVIRGCLHRFSSGTNAHRPSSTAPLPTSARLRLFASRRVFRPSGGSAAISSTLFATRRR